MDDKPSNALQVENLTFEQVCQALRREHHFTHVIPEEGLYWERDAINFANPFKNRNLWIKQACIDMMEHNRKTILLIPHRHQEDYWVNWVVKHATSVRLVLNGVVYPNYTRAVPVELAVVVFDPSMKPEARIEELPSSIKSKPLRLSTTSK